MDTNADGKLDREEVRAYLTKVWEQEEEERNKMIKVEGLSFMIKGSEREHWEKAVAMAEESLKKADLNHDKQIDWDEFVKVIGFPKDTPTKEL